MRQIKFRAWTPSGRIVEFDELMGLRLHTVFKMCQPDMILMQFTGLKDKNGVDIYEGDLLYWEWFVKPVEVIYDENLARFSSTGSVHAWKDYEVIGNIYQNPELLEANNANS